MIICLNGKEEDTDRDDEKVRDGYSACCPKWKCTDEIGFQSQFKKRLGKTPDLIKKYQYLKCYSCKENKYGEMIICKNFKDYDRMDEYCWMGYTACCPKTGC